jgi:hypothetical protein
MKELPGCTNNCRPKGKARMALQVVFRGFFANETDAEPRGFGDFKASKQKSSDLPQNSFSIFT